MRHSPAVKSAAGIRKEKETEIAVGGHHSHSMAEITFARCSDEGKKKKQNKEKEAEIAVGGHPPLSFYGRDNPC